MTAERPAPDTAIDPDDYRALALSNPSPSDVTDLCDEVDRLRAAQEPLEAERERLRAENETLARAYQRLVAESMPNLSPESVAAMEVMLRQTRDALARLEQEAP